MYATVMLGNPTKLAQKNTSGTILLKTNCSDYCEATRPVQELARINQNQGIQH